MKVIFEYKDGTYRVVPTKAYNIEQRTKENCLIDEYITDPKLKNMYMLANDNHIGPFIDHRDLKEIDENIRKHYKNINLLKTSRYFYMDLIMRSDRSPDFQMALDTIENIAKKTMEKMPIDDKEYVVLQEEESKRLYKDTKKQTFIGKLLKMLRR